MTAAVIPPRKSAGPCNSGTVPGGARPEESLLLMYQRYTRALGGVLELELQPAGVAVGS